MKIVWHFFWFGSGNLAEYIPIESNAGLKVMNFPVPIHHSPTTGF